jgi:bacillithiol system protein YtxJ
MTTESLSDTAELERRLASGTLLLFKHSPICPVSARAKTELERFLAARPEVPSALVDVLVARPLSQLVAARSGVRHESPQALLFVDGACVWNASHGAITRAALERAWQARPDAQSGTQV